MAKFHIHSLSRPTYRRTLAWAVILCLCIVAATSSLARAAHNFKAALTDKPDVALYLLLPDEGLKQTTLLKESETERDYLAETANGPKLIRLKKGETQWYVSLTEQLHEGR